MCNKELDQNPLSSKILENPPPCPVKPDPPIAAQSATKISGFLREILGFFNFPVNLVKLRPKSEFPALHPEKLDHLTP